MSTFVILPREMLVQLLMDRKRSLQRILSRSNSLEIPNATEIRHVKEEIKTIQSVLDYDESLTF